MKYIVKKIKDQFEFDQEKAIEEAKKKLLATKLYAAVYGKKVKGKQIYYEPILVNKEALDEMKDEILQEDPEGGSLYVLYRSNLIDSPLYEIEPDKAYIDIPDEEVEKFVKERLIQIANNPRLFNKYKKEFIEILENELQEYATREFYEHKRGEYLDSKKIKDFEKHHSYYDDYEIEKVSEHYPGNITFKNVFVGEGEEYYGGYVGVYEDVTISAEDIIELMYTYGDMSEEEGDEYLKNPSEEKLKSLIDKYLEDALKIYDRHSERSLFETYREFRNIWK